MNERASAAIWAERLGGGVLRAGGVDRAGQGQIGIESDELTAVVLKSADGATR